MTYWLRRKPWLKWSLTMTKTEMIDGQEFTITVIPEDTDATTEAQVEQGAIWQDAREAKNQGPGRVTNRSTLRNSQQSTTQGQAFHMKERRSLGLTELEG